MNVNKSEFLNLVRWASSLLVLAGHSQMIGGIGDPFFTFIASHAHAAVIVFFVLSGYVIAWTVDRKAQFNYTFKEYFIDRFSRIYSVLVPAILLTFILDSVGLYFFNQRYSAPKFVPQDYFILRLIVNLFSLQGIWGHRVQFGSNPALWSIGYEFIYYVFYGLIVWRPRYWLLAITIIAVIVGPNIVVYCSVWFLGVLAFKMQSRVKINTLAGVALVVLANALFQYSSSFCFVELDQFIADFLFAIFAGLFIASNPSVPSNRIFTRVNKEMSGFSFSSYAYHYPIMFMFFSVFPATKVMAWVAVFISLLIARCLSEITENKKLLIKRIIS